MAKIIKRLAEAEYCFTEIQFDSIEEYQKEYKNILKVYVENKDLTAKINQYAATKNASINK